MSIPKKVKSQAGAVRSSDRNSSRISVPRIPDRSICSYAQNFEDVLLWRALQDVREGFYIDVGAQDPVNDSVSKGFYELGWRGLHIEPTPQYADLLRADREGEIVLQVAVSDRPGIIQFFAVPDTGLSSADPKVQRAAEAGGWTVQSIMVPALTLDDIFSTVPRSQEIHWLKIDIEGLEDKAIRGWKTSPRRPWIVVVEAVSPDRTPTHEAWEGDLLEKGYTFAHFDTLNRYYVSIDHADLVPNFDFGPSLWDQFLAPRSSRLNRLLVQSHDAEISRLSTAVASSETRELENVAQTNERIAGLDAALNHVHTLLKLREQEVYQRDVEVGLISRERDDVRAQLAERQEALARAARVEEDQRRIVEAYLKDLRDATADVHAAKIERDRLRFEMERLRNDRARQSLAGEMARAELASRGAEILEVERRAAILAQSLSYAEVRLASEAAMAAAALVKVDDAEATLACALAEVAELRLVDAERIAFVARTSSDLEALQIEIIRERNAFAESEAAFLAQLDDARSALEQSQAEGRASSERAADVEVRVEGVLSALDQARAELRAVEQELSERRRRPLSALVAQLREGPLAREDRPIAPLARRTTGVEPLNLEALLSLPDDAFIIAAYRTLLDREPDAEGIEGHLESLRAGVDRSMVLWAIRGSAEGKTHAVELPGLAKLVARRRRARTLGAVWRTPSAALRAVRGRVSRAWRARVAGPDLSGFPELEALLSLQGQPFVAAAYRVLLEREPEAQEAEPTLAVLREGDDPAAILVAMRESPEGEDHKVDIPGLSEVSRWRKRLAGRGLGTLLRLRRRALERSLARRRLALLESKCDALIKISDVSTERFSPHRPTANSSWKILPNDPDSGASRSFAVGLSRGLEANGIVVLAPTSATSGDVTIATTLSARLGDAPSTSTILAGLDWAETGYPGQWIDRYNAELEAVASLSNHTRKILIDQGVTRPTVVTGSGLDDWRLQVSSRTFRGGGGSFRFLHVSACRPEDGVDLLIAAFLRSFRAADDVSLLIKPTEFVSGAFRAALEETRRSPENAPDIILIEDPLSEAEMKALYQHCQVFVAPVRAGGFGLPIAKALIAGLPVVATAWGGHLDYCNEQTGWLVDYDFGRAAVGKRRPASLWAEPKPHALDGALRAARVASAAMLREKAAVGDAMLLERATWLTAARRLAEVVKGSPPLSERRQPIAMVTTWNFTCGIASHVANMLHGVPENEVFILAGRQTPTLGPDGPNVSRAWNVEKGSNGLEALLEQIAERDISTLIIQFNYGFFNHRELSDLIERAFLANISVFVDFHSTTDPIDTEEFRISEILPALRKCHRLLVHGPADMNRFKDLGLIDNVMLFPLGVVRSPHRRERHGILNDPPLLATFGFALPNKGLVEIVQAIGHLRDRGLNTRLLMLNAEHFASVSADVIASIRENIDRLGLNGLVEFRSEYLDEDTCLSLLSDADLIVNPYQNTAESASAAIRYAMATGCPVAVTPLSIFDDLGEAAFRMPGLTPDLMADGIAEVLNHLREQSPLAERVQIAAKSWLEVHDVNRQWTQLTRLAQTLAQRKETEPGLLPPKISDAPVLELTEAL